MARKRKAATVGEGGTAKRLKTAPVADVGTSAGVQCYAVLQCYYNTVVSLRTYILSRLPCASKRRRRFIQCVDRHECQGLSEHASLARLLDSVLVGSNGSSPQNQRPLDRSPDITAFSQQLSASTVASGIGRGHMTQSEVGHIASKVKS